MNIIEKFELSDGITILVCTDPKVNVVGKRFRLIKDDKIRQVITVCGERKMKNQTTNLNQKAFEINDTVNISTEDAQSGDWQLIGEYVPR